MCPLHDFLLGVVVPFFLLEDVDVDGTSASDVELLLCFDHSITPIIMQYLLRISGPSVPPAMDKNCGPLNHLNFMALHNS
jgi:hypothetical protein